MSKHSTQQVGKTIEIGPYESGVNSYIAPAQDILFLLRHADVDVNDCLFSGYAAKDGLVRKEETDFSQYQSMPDEASDDALLFFYDPDITVANTNNPLWYAFKESDETGESPRIDVYSKRALDRLILPSLILESYSAWITPEQLETVQIGSFIVKLTD